MHIMKSFPLIRSVTTATWPLPSSEGCRPPYTGFQEGVRELGGGCEGRPMVWETREVREENWVGTPVVYLRPRCYTA